MTTFLELIEKAVKFSLHSDDDTFDRLSHRYTLGVLLVSTFICGTKQYVGDPIDCWSPAHFGDQHVKYVDNVCWISNTFYVPPDENLPFDVPTRQDRELSYYQWVPFILLSMAFLFYFPRIVWSVFNGTTGLDITGIVITINSLHLIDPDDRKKKIEYIVRHMDNCFKLHKKNDNGCCPVAQQWLADKLCLLCGKKFGNQIICMYIIVKLLFIANAVSQLFLMNAFLETDYNAYGLEVMGKLINGSVLRESHRFPSVTMCDFVIRRMGGVKNIHRYTVQCVLPINLFNERIFVFLWFWIVMVAAFSIGGLLSWILTLFRQARVKYVKKYLKFGTYLNQENKEEPKAFTEEYLRQDGVFVLRLVSKNTNDITMAELVVALWENYIKQKPARIK